jgi:hypothetical protein
MRKGESEALVLRVVVRQKEKGGRGRKIEIGEMGE